MTGYAKAKEKYQELRAAIDPWARANGFTRTKGTQAEWEKTVNDRERLSFRFESLTFVVPEIGHSFHGYVQLEPASETRGTEIIRQTPFECCLVQAELDELARIQGTINARRPPPPPDLARHMPEDTILGHGLREDYNAHPRYREGECLRFGYHGLQDVKDLAVFIARVLPDALQRFVDGRVAKPVSTTPKHLVPKWLDRVTKLPNG